MTEPDPYAVLGVPAGTSDADALRDAYRAAARRSHPDIGGSIEAMQRVNAAYELLSDPLRRAEYDAERAGILRPPVAPPGRSPAPQPATSTPAPAATSRPRVPPSVLERAVQGVRGHPVLAGLVVVLLVVLGWGFGSLSGGLDLVLGLGLLYLLWRWYSG
jgi:DnaJ domain